MRDVILEITVGVCTYPPGVLPYKFPEGVPTNASLALTVNLSLGPARRIGRGEEDM
jgi:hypothetical protein